MIQRDLGPALLRSAKQYPVVVLTGPRQSGKTTLCRSAFPDHAYVNLEAPDQRQRIKEDPIQFLKDHASGVIIDEAQHFPELLSWIQVQVDEHQENGRFIITGSQNFLLMKNISQSPAGRAALLQLLPLSIAECLNAKLINSTSDWHNFIYSGFYPRILAQGQEPREALTYYVQTYLERDIRNLAAVHDLGAFHRFLRLLAGRTGSQLNKASLANEAGISQGTVSNWLSLLETSYIITLVQPYLKNFNKRLTKAPKLYFLDCGLAASLIGIDSSTQVKTHPLRGQLFETMIVAELFKQDLNQARRPQLYFFRDSNGQEVDIVREKGPVLEAIEIKASATWHSDFFKGLDWFHELSDQNCQRTLVYGGNESFTVKDRQVSSWGATPY